MHTVISHLSPTLQAKENIARIGHHLEQCNNNKFYLASKHGSCAKSNHTTQLSVSCTAPR